MKIIIAVEPPQSSVVFVVVGAGRGGCLALSKTVIKQSKRDSDGDSVINND